MDLEQLLGREPALNLIDARGLLDSLIELWNSQASLIRASAYSRETVALSASVDVDLTKLHYWFNPTATGKRLRESLELLQPSISPLATDLGNLVERIDSERALVAPEGRVAMWLLAAGLKHQADPASSPNDTLWLSQRDIHSAWSKLTNIYRRWDRQRLVGVTSLLREETATLRPSVIGLLLVLLINRNTSRERRLPAPTDAQMSADVSRAIAEPALAFVRALSGERDSRADARGLEVYRGWAIGEIARRLGNGFHRDDGVWIDESAVPVAEDRLIASLVSRPPGQLRYVTTALQELIDSYQQVRPALTALGIAHERPSVTRRLVDRVSRAVRSTADEPPSSEHPNAVDHE